MKKQTPEALEHIVRAAVYAHHNPISCNMFPLKPCGLLTCRAKGCLWTKEEVEKQKSKPSL